MIITAEPLYWPEGWKRKKSKEHSRFSSNRKPITIYQATLFVLDELRKMGIPDWQVIISSNLKLKQDGYPYSNQKAPEDTGVSVWWNQRHESKVIALDKYYDCADNLHAIGKTIEALRGIERWGGGEILDRSFKGFVALPSNQAPWRDVLDYYGHKDGLEYAFRVARSKSHPDKGGSTEAFDKVLVAYDSALKEFGIIK